MPGKVAPGRHLVAVVDETAATNPDKPLFSISNSPTDASQGWQDVTYGRFSNAINRVTQYLLDIFRGRGRDFQAFAYVGYNDTRYAMVMMAAIKAGYKALFISPRNSLEGQISLLKSTGAIGLLYGHEYQHLMEPVVAATDILAHVVPTEQEWLDPTPVQHFGLDSSRSLAQIAWDPVLVLHTSGSTGIPKPVVLKLANFLIADSYQNLRSPNFDRKTFVATFTKAKKFLAPMPMFHVAGILPSVIFAIYYDFVSVLPCPAQPITVDTIIQTIDHTGCESGLVPPAILQELASDENALKRLSKWSTVLVGGGPTSDITAERLRGVGVKALNLIGATETVPIPVLETTSDEFPYFLFSEPEFGGFEWRKVPQSGPDELYELWIKRLPDWSHQGIFYVFPEIDEFDTRDIFRKVPGKEGFWQYYARSDDVIVFSNGEKLNPVDIEGAVCEDPLVRGALVVGQSRFQAALLIEPRQYPADDAGREKLIDKIWPRIEEINQVTVTHGVILKNFIALTTPDKPLPRAGKGTVQRALADKLYESEIEELYARAGTIETAPLDVVLDSEEALLQSLVKAFQTTLGLRGAKMNPDAEFFALGIDSMQVLTMSRNLKIALDRKNHEIHPDTISPRAIYKSATLRGLSRTIFAQADPTAGQSVNGHLGRIDSNGQPNSDLQDLIAQFTANLPTVTELPSEDSAQTYLITGTTGAIGPYLLDGVLASSPAHVFAMNRDATAAERQIAAHESRGLSTDFSFVTFLTTDFSLPGFGLDQAQLANIKARTTRIIHNAWPVNFNIPLSSFIPSIAGVCNLVDLAATGSKKPHITFISTIATVAAAAGPAKEKAYPPDAASLPYAQSKAVSSMILDMARTKGVRSAIVRVGQVAGPIAAKGEWKRAEWFPTLLASSAGMGMVPSNLGPLGARVDWLPVEAVADTILDVSNAAASGYYHAVNPAATSYGELLPEITKYFGTRVEAAGLQEWVDALKKHAAVAKNEDDIKKVPGIKLLDFYESLLADGSESTLETEQTEVISKTLRTVGPVRPEWMANWLRQWSF